MKNIENKDKKNERMKYERMRVGGAIASLSYPNSGFIVNRQTPSASWLQRDSTKVVFTENIEFFNLFYVFHCTFYTFPTLFLFYSLNSIESLTSLLPTLVYHILDN